MVYGNIKLPACSTRSCNEIMNYARKRLPSGCVVLFWLGF